MMGISPRGINQGSRVHVRRNTGMHSLEREPFFCFFRIDQRSQPRGMVGAGKGQEFARARMVLARRQGNRTNWPGCDNGDQKDLSRA